MTGPAGGKVLFSGQVEGLDHQYFVFADGGEDVPAGEDLTGVLSVTDDTLVVFCGVDTDSVDVTITAGDPGSATSWADWDDVAEASLDGGEEGLWLAHGDGSAVDDGDLAPGRVPYRIRVMVKGRDLRDTEGGTIREHHHLHIWQQPYSASVLLQARDQTGEVHGRASSVQGERS